MTIGEKLRYFRISSNISQLELECEIGAAAGSISRIENGLVNPSKETIYKISDFLGLNLFQTSELLGIKFNKTEQYIPKKYLYQEIANGLNLKQILTGDYKEYAFLTGKDRFVKECDSVLTTSPNEILYFKNINNWRKAYPEELANSYHVPKRMDNNTFAKFILNGSEMAKEFKDEDRLFFRESRLLKNNSDFEYTLLIDQEHITIFIADTDIVSFTIKDVDIARKAREAFYTIW